MVIACLHLLTLYAGVFLLVVTITVDVTVVVAAAIVAIVTVILIVVVVIAVDTTVVIVVVAVVGGGGGGDVSVVNCPLLKVGAFLGIEDRRHDQNEMIAHRRVTKGVTDDRECCFRWALLHLCFIKEPHQVILTRQLLQQSQ